MSLQKSPRAQAASAAQTDWLDDLLPPPLGAEQTVQWLARWTEEGLLRHIDSAFAAQLLRQDAQVRPALLVAAALLAQMEGRGHTCLPVSELCEAPAKLLGWPAAGVLGPQGLQALWSHLPGTVPQWLDALQASCVRGLGAVDQGQPLVLGGSQDAPLLYLRRYASYEQRVGQGLLRRAGEPLPVHEQAARGWLDRFFAPNPQEPAGTDWQKVACAVALRARLSVITGGPGTGKTYTAARLLALLLALHEQASPLRVALAAPTGKAAARLKQSIDHALVGLQTQVPRDSGLDLTALIARMGPARTLHALLGARPQTRALRHHEANLLDLDVLIVDEASMVHLEMMDALLLAMPPHARLVLLGDKDQLASVEAGAVLGDLCHGAAQGRYGPQTADFVERVAGQRLAPELVLTQQAAPVLAQQTVMLRQSRRFKGVIGQLALAVNRGDPVAARSVLLSCEAGPGALPVWAQQSDNPRVVCDLALGASGKPSYVHYLQAMHQGPTDRSVAAHDEWVRGVLASFERFRILCAVRQGEWGTEALNAAVQKALADEGWLRPQGDWFAGRPVMVTRNDPQLGVFNGDVGVVLPGLDGRLKAWFLEGQALRSVSVMRLAQVETAFAMTVHKSQGSEFEHTALVLPPGGAVLSRELVYTGITRAREQFTLLEAEADLLEAAVARPGARASGLSQWWS